MSVTLLVVVAAAGVAALLAVLVGMWASGSFNRSSIEHEPDPGLFYRDRVPTPPATPPGAAPAPGPAAAPRQPDATSLVEVERLARSGQKIEAIKLLRQLTGRGLKEAKEAVDELERGGAMPARALLAAPPPGGPAGDEVERLIREGQLIAAIKVHRERTGLGLKEAKDAVEKLRDELQARGDRS